MILPPPGVPGNARVQLREILEAKQRELGMPVISEASRARMSARFRGQPQPHAPETNKKISRTQRARHGLGKGGWP